LRNPLAPIRYALQLLDHPAQPAQPDPRLVIDRQIAHLVRLVDDLLDATRISSNKIQLRRERIDLVPLVHHAVESARPEIVRAEQVMEVSLPSSPIWLDADADRLTQVLSNLLNNASRYTPSGGRIRISASGDGEAVVLSVADTGIGLDPADAARVFDMFTQIAGPGTGGLGIGLALVKGIAELHGGSVEVRSEGIGHGAEFVVRLPAAAGAAAAATPAEEPRTPRAPSRRVLVVDDNADSAAMMAAVLELQGHEVRVACDGHQAVEAAVEFVPDVALLDIGLPGLSGYEVAQRMRTDPRTCSAHLIAVTGWGHEEDRQRALESGFDAHLTKPADPEHIIELVARSVSSTGGIQQGLDPS
jgi:CheY-like chemotaxis protein/two-component sensor histidine kinase